MSILQFLSVTVHNDGQSKYLARMAELLTAVPTWIGEKIMWVLKPILPAEVINDLLLYPVVWMAVFSALLVLVFFARKAMWMVAVLGCALVATGTIWVFAR